MSINIEEAVDKSCEYFKKNGLIEEIAKELMKTHAESLAKFISLVDSVLRDHPEFKEIQICKHLKHVCAGDEKLADIQTTTKDGCAQYVLKDNALWKGNAQFYIITDKNQHLMMPILNELMKKTRFSYNYKEHKLVLKE